MILFITQGCFRQDSSRSLPSSSGKPLEILVVCDSSLWTSGIQEAVENILLAEHPGLPQREPLFRMYCISPQKFGSLFKNARSILILSTHPQQDKPVFSRQYNAWAKEQLVVKIKTRNKEELHTILKKNKKILVTVFRDFEIEQLIKHFSHHYDQKAYNEVVHLFGKSVLIPEGYVKAKSAPEFTWFRKDVIIGDHEIMRGFFLYTKPYKQMSDWNVKNIIAYRDSILSLYVHGRTPSSYMTTYKEYVPDSAFLNIRGMPAKETRGLWHMKHEFMGGPFLLMVYLDEPHNKMYYVDTYLFAPYFDKRQYMLELEAIAKSFGRSIISSSP